jgi:hypothetical protein
VPRVIVDLPTDDPADIILIGGLPANDFGAPTVVPAAEIKPQLRSAILVGIVMPAASAAIRGFGDEITANAAIPTNNTARHRVDALR